ncbi:MAG TPA: hypothetical protein VKD72_20575, partial [Gemmataceae bacterium]|nr:hypothetical protein [Gemmataceae bacterium]
MSSSDPPAKVRVDLRAADDVTELTVFDGQFQQVGRGFGRIQTKLAPGLYTVRLRAGGTTRDRLLSIGPSDTEVVATYPALSFVSAAPLEGSVKSRESQREAATQFASLSAPLGNGSALFVFARNWDPTGPPLQGEAEPDPAQGLSIWDATGQQQIADLSAAGSGRMSGPSWVACSVLVEPGGYRLRQTLADGRGYELALVASPGWQTQVFLPPLRRDKSDQSPKFSGATILLSKDGGFDPSSPGSRLVELARQALCRKVTAVTPEVIRQILSAKLNNPMLGLIGAHLVLASSSDQDHQALFTDPLVLLRNLRGLLGDAHPDVEALALKLTPGPSAFRFTYPPMLRRSWALVIDASTSQPELVPNDSPAARIASRVCGPEPWLVWRAGEDDTEEVLESVLEEHLRIAAPDAGPLEAVPSRSLEARLGERGLKSLAHSLGLPGGQVKALVQRAGTRTVRAQPLPMEVPEKPEPTPLAPRAEIVQTRAAYERDRGARFILETWAPVDLRQAERAARDRLGRACEVEPLFPQADDRAWLGRFFLARLPGVRFGDLPDSPFDWAYNVRDGADLFRS